MGSLTYISKWRCKGYHNFVFKNVKINSDFTIDIVMKCKKCGKEKII